MDTPVHAPVFIYAPPCTGSTTLHGVLAANKDHFCAVEMHELLLPFIATAKMHDWIRVGQVLPGLSSEHLVESQIPHACWV